MLTNVLHLQLPSNMMDNVFPLRFQSAAGGLEADAPPFQFSVSGSFIHTTTALSRVHSIHSSAI